MADELLQDLVGDGCDITAKKGGNFDMADAADGGGDDLGRIAKVALQGDDLLDELCGIPAVVVKPSQERGKIGGMAFHGKKGLGGREAEGDVGRDVFLVKGVCHLESLDGHRKLDDDVARLDGIELMGLGEHAFTVLGRDLGGDRAIDELGDMLDDFLLAETFLRDQGRVRRDAGDERPMAGLLDFLQVCRIDE